MGLKSKTYYINKKAQAIAGENITWNYHRGNHIQVGWNFRTDNHDFIGSQGAANATINPDLVNVIKDPTPNSVGDLIVSAGWGDGFAVRKLHSAGSMSILFTDTTCPVNASCNSIALDRLRNQAYVGGYSNAGIAKYDFADTSSISQVDTITIAANGISHQECGYPYYNGLGVAGDWLYLGHDDIGDYNYTTKWNTQDSSSDDLLAWNRITDMRYGFIRYYPKEDWIMSSWLRDGDTILIRSASIASSSFTGNQAVCLRTTDLGISNDHYNHGTILMKTGSDNIGTGSPYRMMCPGFMGRFLYVDNSFLTGSVWAQEGKIIRQNAQSLNKAEVRYVPQAKELYYGTWFENPIIKDKLIICGADRNHLAYMGWIDQINMVMVGDPIYYTNGYGTGDIRTGGGGQTVTYESDGNEFFAGYGGCCVLATGEDGLEYFIFSMYTGDDFRAYSKVKFPYGLVLCETGSVTFGDFSLDDNSNIGSIYVGNTQTDLYTASGADLYVKVSNDGGTTYETYPYLDNDTYEFTSEGNTARVKLEFTGSISQSAHYTGGSYLYATIMEKDISQRESVVGYSRFNLTGV